MGPARLTGLHSHAVRILSVADGLWTFLEIEGIEPTNNAAE